MKRLIRDEKGQALLATLLLLLIGSLIVTPVLGFMGTGMRSGRVYEQKNDEIYAADSGVEDALWNIRNDLIEDLLGVPPYDEYNYSSPYPYPYVLSVNDKDVAVTIQNVWIPKDIALPTPGDAKKIIADEKLLIIGYPGSSPSTYVIKIVCNWGTNTTIRDLKVEKIGIWLSPGFEYVTGSSDFEKASGQPYYSVPAVSLYKGGSAVVWNFASQPFLKLFPPSGTPSPMVKTFTFQYTGPEGQIPELVSSWIDTTGATDIPYSWDDSIRLYKIVSQAGGVQIDAYGAKTKFRKLKSTISSDYAVAGNRLSQPTATSGDDSHFRNKLYTESSSTLQRIGLQSIPPSGIVPAGYIPEEAIIEDVYLYWSGWIDYHYWYQYWQYGRWYYEWREIADLKYGSRTNAQLIANSKVDKVKFGVGSSAQTITADNWQIVNTSDCSDASSSWVYSCFKDVTDLVVSGGMTVREYIENAMKTAGSGTVAFTGGHADEVRGVHRPESNPAGAYANYYFALDGDGSTGYPLATPAHKKPGEGYQTRYEWSYAGWSLIIFYRSPALIQRQLYLYDDLRYRSFLGGGDDPTFTISGFLAPPVISENDKSHLSYFVGEGDNHYSGDSIKANTYYLSDPGGNPNPQSNVFNSRSNALPTLITDGVDVDTFVLPTNCIMPYDTSATITLLTNQEIYTLVYLVLSFRSELTTGGIITNYAIKII